MVGCLAAGPDQRGNDPAGLAPAGAGRRILGGVATRASAPAPVISSGRWAWRPVPVRFLASPRLHLALGVISFCSSFFSPFTFARGAWRTAQANVDGASVPGPARQSSISRGYFLGLILALTSPWNIGFWFAVVGGQGAAQGHTTFLNSLTLAAAVVSGAVAWTIVLLYGAQARCAHLCPSGAGRWERRPSARSSCSFSPRDWSGFGGERADFLRECGHGLACRSS